ncbi:MAG: hypothetical protein BRD30_03585, partial [Bacteroidetes bacterium QH_2_63_10]
MRLRAEEGEEPVLRAQPKLVHLGDNLQGASLRQNEERDKGKIVVVVRELISRVVLLLLVLG